MVKSINFYYLWVSEFIQFLKDLISICRNSDAAGLHIEVLLGSIEESIHKLELLLRREEGSDLTKEIAELDERRDKALVTLVTLTKGFTTHFEEAKSLAAEKIITVIDKYGSSIYDLNYRAETTILSNLVRDLESDAEAAVAVNTLELKPVVDEIKTANTQFNEKYLARIDERSEMPNENTVELRKTAISQYRGLVGLLEGYMMAYGPDKYLEVVNKLNELIDKYSETITSRREKGEAETEEEDAI